MATFAYRLQPLLGQKLERREQLQRELAERQRELSMEEQALAELREQQRRIEEKHAESRRGLLAGASGVTAYTIGLRKDYLQGLAADLESARNAEFSQKLRVEEAEERVASAKREFGECCREVEVLKKHRERLEKRFLKEQERKEAVEMDEAGNAAFLQRSHSR